MQRCTQGQHVDPGQSQRADLHIQWVINLLLAAPLWLTPDPYFLEWRGVSGRQGHANSFPPISFWMTPWLHTIHTFHSPTNTSHHPRDHLMRHIGTLPHPQWLNAHSLVQVHDVISEKKLIIFLSQQLESGGWKTVPTVLLKTMESLGEGWNGQRESEGRVRWRNRARLRKNWRWKR